jgi:hypothetical protein
MSSRLLAARPVAVAAATVIALVPLLLPSAAFAGSTATSASGRVDDVTTQPGSVSFLLSSFGLPEGPGSTPAA